MALVRVETGYRSRYWNIGDTIEMDGEQLKQELVNGNVSLVQELANRTSHENQVASGASGDVVAMKKEDKKGEKQCEVCQKVLKNEFGYKGHMRSHK